ncbi:peptidoglycan-associated lipoprotein Pal [Pseudohalocynthiibacter aestuariivivens]|jgi:peptidoglycan-associated lipoprotein|uniref:Peptidoglycan-associated lipoprotein n=1 Tax=Pseudohalocynthiibacter aestuariivivens TaxID=1591409 RepID=A0ABV5JAV6_9RHOB|nr:MULTISPECIES: peptidoglycan-associated lipoprotein Pal [Pseudohalocynthiibacter]MBS9715881.1 peptidoglycan-associated lipoprotein Pal [Pseudohalocynthiibacter aestuariivivens]MCK0101494.1 peptidoglycan-associated lipoprotein Pal [Pseudohalocynthiibacter sp. F2068]
MKHLSKAVLVVAALTLAACTDPSRLGGGYGGAGANGAAGGLNDPSNPISPAYFQQTIGDRVLFAVDQSTLSDGARATLAGQAGWLAENPEYDALIEGHADEQGTREYNLALGARRANAVQEYLISRGVAPNRLSVVSFGKERPIEVCSNESCYERNRRAVTVISAGGLGS